MKRNSQKEGRSCETASGVVCLAVIIMASSRLIGARSKAARKRWRFFFNKQESRISPERCRVYAHKRGVVRKWAGGKYVAGGFNKTTTLNGAPPPNRVVIVQFESMAKVKAWWDSEDQRAATKIGEKYATLNTFVVEGAMPK